MNVSKTVVGGLVIYALLAFFPFCWAQSEPTEDRIPKSVDEAVLLLKSELTQPVRDLLLRTPREDAQAELHFPFGMGLRNRFKLWGGQNPELMKSCGVSDPDGCSWIILGGLWDAVRSEADPELVRQLDCQFKLTQSVHINYKGFDRLTTGQLLQALQSQIDQQISALKASGTPVCQNALTLRPVGDPNFECFVRAEFARENKRANITLDRLLGWIGWRNSFEALPEPPTITLKFKNRCAWPKRPRIKSVPLPPATLDSEW